MWKRDNPPSPSSAPTAPSQPAPSSSTPARQERVTERTLANIGKSVIIKGELNGSEDLTVEGQVEGKIDLSENVLTIGPNGRIRAQIFAKAVVVQGQVFGNITATDRVVIRENGSVEGDIATPRFAIAEGALFRGKVDMQGAAAPGARGRAVPPIDLDPLAELAEAGAEISDKDLEI
jgi:cytoskeletal protein CcmA (bactofilin family)